ncbi:hypothetical protein HK101_010729 [Irineochytrium annulatum]|nr:hypothetical protein HK101_010729 [Irineochytrium annulatum]
MDRPNNLQPEVDGNFDFTDFISFSWMDQGNPSEVPPVTAFDNGTKAELITLDDLMCDDRESMRSSVEPETELSFAVFPATPALPVSPTASDSFASATHQRPFPSASGTQSLFEDLEFAGASKLEADTPLVTLNDFIMSDQSMLPTAEADRELSFALFPPAAAVLDVAPMSPTASDCVASPPVTSPPVVDLPPLKPRPRGRPPKASLAAATVAAPSPAPKRTAPKRRSARAAVKKEEDEGEFDHDTRRGSHHFNEEDFDDGLPGEPIVAIPEKPMDEDLARQYRLLKDPALSAKERRQLRNKLSARSFRERRKDYIDALENEVRLLRKDGADSKKELQTVSAERDQLRVLVADLTARLQRWEGLAGAGGISLSTQSSKVNVPSPRLEASSLVSPRRSKMSPMPLPSTVSPLTVHAVTLPSFAVAAPMLPNSIIPVAAPKLSTAVSHTPAVPNVLLPVAAKEEVEPKLVSLLDFLRRSVAKGGVLVDTCSEEQAGKGSVTDGAVRYGEDGIFLAEVVEAPALREQKLEPKPAVPSASSLRRLMAAARKAKKLREVSCLVRMVERELFGGMVEGGGRRRTGLVERVRPNVSAKAPLAGMVVRNDVDSILVKTFVVALLACV